MRIMAIDLFATHKRMSYSALPKLSLMKDTSLDVVKDGIMEDRGAK